jgi:hypothetical protein
MVRKEIDILVEAARKSCAVVEKTSHVLWTHADLLEARACGRYQESGQLLPPDRHMELSSPYPGCIQMAGLMEGTNAYRAVGQTQHFVIFANPSTVE